MEKFRKTAKSQRIAPDRQAVARNDVPAVGHVLRRAREHHGFALREVERRTGRSSAYLSQVERGLIRQPDPVVLLELADLYKLDFMTLAKWAGWTGESQPHAEGSGSGTLVVRRVLELDDTQRAEVLRYIETLLKQKRT